MPKFSMGSRQVWSDTTQRSITTETVEQWHSWTPELKDTGTLGDTG